MKISDKWKRVLGSAMSSLPQDDSKPQPTSFLSRVVALGRKYEPKVKQTFIVINLKYKNPLKVVIVIANIFTHRTKCKDEH